MKCINRFINLTLCIILLSGLLCACGSKATVNARLDGNMNVVTEGAQVLIGGNESYIAMCHRCWQEKIKNQKN